MTISVAIAIAGLFVTMIAGFARVLLELGGIRTQLALLWAWYLAECGPGIPGGRRRTDPPASYANLEPRPPGGSVA